MAKDLGILTAVVLLSILASLALSQEIQAVVLKGISFTSSCFTARKARFIPSMLAETAEES